MKRMTKILAIITLFLLALALAACGGQDGEKTITSVSVSFDQGENVINEGASLDTLKEYLTVKLCYSDGTEEAITDYTLSGTLAEGENIITVKYGELEKTFTVNVSKVAASGHTHTLIHYEAVDATCKANGNIEYYACAECGKKYSDAEAQNEISEIIIPVAHIGGIEIRGAKAPTTEEEGYTGDTYCLGCEEKIASGKTIGKLDHIHNMVKTEKVEETCTEDGNIEYYTCTVCEKIFTDKDGIYEISAAETVIKAAHKIENHEAQPETCTENGWNAYETCSRCSYSTYEEISAKHNYSEGVCTRCGKEIEYSVGLQFAPNGDGTCSVSGIGTCTDTDIVVPPQSPKGNRVTSIGKKAFFCKSFTSIVIPDSVTSIGESAFDSCDRLVSVVIPNSVASIGDFAFEDCINLTSLVIPNSVASIGNSAFYNCYKLVEIINHSSLNIIAGSEDYGYAGYYAKEVHTGESKMLNKDGYLFITVDNINYLLGYVGTEKALTLPESYNGETYEIYKYAFYGNDDITSVMILGSVVSIGNAAFRECSSLASVVIPDSVTSIGNSAFSDCRRLKYNEYDNAHYLGNDNNPYVLLVKAKNTSISSCSVNASTKIVHSSAFHYCDNLTSVVIPDSVISIGSYAFSHCSALESITLPFVGGNANATSASASTLFGYIFNASGYIGGVAVNQHYSNSTDSYKIYYIPKSLKAVTVTGGDILYGAFAQCTTLTSITIGDGVKVIEDNAFLNCESLTSLTIGKSVKSIGEEAFYSCDSLVNIVIPNATTSIGDYAFAFCQKLKNVTVGDNVESIGENAFYSCDSLTSIILPDSLVTIGANAFSHCLSLESITLPFVGGSANATKASQSTKFKYIFGNIPSNLKSVTITGGNILDDAFENCTSITNVIMGDRITTIGDDAFSGCTGLVSIIIPDSVTAIGNYAFQGCRNLTSLEIGESVESIGNYAFYNCDSLTSVVIGDSVTSIGNSAFSYCYKLVEIINNSSLEITAGSYSNGEVARNALVVHDGESKIANKNDYLFISLEDANYLVGYTGSDKTLTLPENYNGENYLIYKYALYKCNITSVIISDSVTSIGSSAFSGCSSITSVVIPDSITSIGSSAFSGCSSLTSITIGNGVELIGDYAFAYCSSLTNVEIPDSVTSIGNSAFRDCNSLTSVHISDMAAWCEILFSDAYSNPLFYANNLYCDEKLVTNLSIPEKVEHIGEYAFYNCTSFVSVTIPNSVMTIGAGAFSGCTSLESITLPFVGSSMKANSDTYQYPFGYIFGTDKYIGGIETKQTYYDSSTSDTISTTYYIPASLKSVIIRGGNILRGSFENCNSISNVTLPNNITSIGDYAFYNCRNLANITIPNSVTAIGEKAFYRCDNFTSVVIPDGVVLIGSSAFAGCSSLESITLPFIGAMKDGTSNTHFGYILGVPYQGDAYHSNLKNVVITKETNIDSYAFYNFRSIESVTIPDSVTTIGAYAFFECRSLASLTIGVNVKSIGSEAFGGHVRCCPNVYIKDISAWAEIAFQDVNANPLRYNLYLDGEIVTNIIIPDCTTKINKYAFYDYTILTSVTIGEGVESIGEYAFSGCKNLTDVLLGNNVTTIGEYAFEKCISLTNLSIKDCVKEIEKGAFSSCENLTNIIVPKSVTSIGYAAFFGCSSLESMTLPFIGSNINYSTSACTATMFGYLFGSSYYTGCIRVIQKCHYDHNHAGDGFLFYLPATLKSVTVTGGDIPVGAFNHCTMLDNVVIYNAESINANAFSACTGLVSVTISNVKSIGKYAFSGCSTLASVIIGDGVESIGEDAFNNCSSLTSVVIGDGVTTIGNFAFEGCTSLTSVVIPDSVENIGVRVFEDCDSLKYNEYDNAHYLGNVNNPYVLLVKAKNTSISFCNINSNTKLISSVAFSGCRSLTSVVIPDSVTSIGYDAFENCDSLKYNEYDNACYLGNVNNPYVVLVKAKNSSISLCNINSNTKVIFYDAFSGCASLASIVIPNSVKSIGPSAFYDCDSLTSIVIPDSVTSIGSSAFSYCRSLTSVVIPDSVTSIGSHAFYNCTSLTSVVIGDSVTRIGEYAFYSCDSLTSIVIPDGVTSIGYEAFHNCYKLVEIINNSSLEITVGSYSNGEVASNALVVHDGESKIVNKDGYLFITVDNINYLLGYTGTDKALTLPESYNGENYEIYKYAFYDRDDITSVIIPDSVTSIGSSAFSSCTSLTSVVIGDSVTSIGNMAFYLCDSLTSVVIPDSVESIGYYAFYYCYSLTSVVIGDSVENIGERAFYNCDSLTSVVIGDSVTSIGSHAFYNCTSLTSVVIGDSVTRIGEYAFYSCDSLTSVEFKNTTGWFVTTSSSATSGMSVDVTDTAQNASYLKSTYYNYHWKRK